MDKLKEVRRKVLVAWGSHQKGHSSESKWIENFNSLLECYHKGRKLEEQRETIKKLLSHTKKKPWWAWNQWNFGWFTLTQDFERINFNLLFDICWTGEDRPLIGISILFWNLELTFGN
ncbi:hypothetical protein LCGC14_0246330 [marine sediment metagenome]|uniref:Uncharacterized protein n=1 Tax=marine sediment metagenome TaxID=412755 RepID=A0A0F9UMM1_9ZZZZ